MLCPLTSARSPVIFGGKSWANIKVKVKIPLTTAPGTYYIGQTEDFRRDIKETNEANNIRIIGITVTGTGTANLQPAVLTPTPHRLKAGDKVELAIAARNIGT